MPFWSFLSPDKNKTRKTRRRLAELDENANISPNRHDSSFDTSNSADNGDAGESSIAGEISFTSEEESIASYQEKIRHSSSTESTATYLNNLGFVYQKNAQNSTYNIENNNDLASRAYKASLKLKVKDFGNDHVSVATTLNNLGSVYFSNHQYEKSLKSYKRALKIMKKQLGADHLNVATVYNNIGDVHYSLQNDEMALKHYNRALAIRKFNLMEKDVRIARLQEKIGLILWKKEVAESHNQSEIFQRGQEDDVTNLRLELYEEMAKIDDLAGDIKFHVELISRKREGCSLEGGGKRKKVRA
uniref:Kinesin light chain n=1 Tax=Leptocylindrus danicus TaxID=163516 RepID=A0A7S2P6C0_9STRA|mmetsp:Transcript_24071/g.36114  ORF Transcript_24071/g.36114 Transcript_24071/m.36114 type:complete len:302 (+) Transcript_24071:199-1104(+)|eukprot:CAMPEP_0116026516 /NCGR_PEP_ID=MMETSP0321-20121206/13915_1 /TAXON_ID=163516 /ORGANISM="Leptocylindrus danicus var. danicus, Strain B650" /LENGTH=301 /DNA_ID=CAMNT_0003499365 /DNA_START=157 /DNA_END=1062 /DNA_ORIENTATION=+